MSISKELLSEVLDREVINTEEHPLKIGLQEITYWYKKDNRVKQQCYLNIYELGHLCKEWAYGLGYIIIQDNRGYTMVKSISNSNKLKFWEDKNSDLCIDRVFLACEWILKEMK